jgi:phosphonate transport system permease protein
VSIDLTERSGETTSGPAMPPRWRRPSPIGVGVSVIVAALVIHGFVGTGIDPSRLLQAPSRTWDFLSKAFPPALDRAPNLGMAMLETLEIALIGTILGITLSLPAALLAADNTAPHRVVAVLMRSALTTMRSIPDLVWALIFVVSVGLGPLAGILTITIDVLAFAGRFFAERIEEIEPGPVEALRSTGAGRLAVIFGAIVPTAFPSLTGTSMYSLEKSVRGAVVLGLVGAGGIGVELNVAFQLRQFDTALTIIILILVVVLLVERLSSHVRTRLISG